MCRLDNYDVNCGTNFLFFVTEKAQQVETCWAFAFIGRSNLTQ